MTLRASSPSPRRGEFVTRRLNGGLNYGFTQGLTASELRDGGDFDISESGAIGSRRALKPFTTAALPRHVKSSFAWQDKARHEHMFIVMDDGEILVATDGATSFGTSVFGNMTDGNSRCTPHFWSAGRWLYVSDGYRVLRWGGIGYPSFDVRTTVFLKPTTATPVAEDSGIPPNCAAVTFRDMAFIANTLVYDEDNDAVLWSLPVAEQPDGTPLEHVLTGQEDYYEDQRITFIAGAQSDYINKLIAAGPALYAFKRHSIHGLSVTATQTLASDITTDLGLAGPEAVAVNGSDVWFFDEHQGLHVMSGNSNPIKVFDPIYPLLDCARITRPWLVAVGVDGDRVFVSCCLDNDEGARNNVTFVLNTKLNATSKGGAWSRWDVGFSSFCHWQPQDGDSSLVGFTTQFRDDNASSPIGAVRINECSESLDDDYGFDTRPIVPWFRTAFFDDGLPTLTKRWGWAGMTLVGSARTKLQVRASTSPVDRPQPECHLPDPSRPTLPDEHIGHVDIDLTPYVSSGEGTQAFCDTDSKGQVYNLGRSIASTTPDSGELAGRVKRVVSPGRGVAFALEVHDEGSEAAWEIDGINVKYDAIIEYS